MVLCNIEMMRVRIMIPNCVEYSQSFWNIRSKRTPWILVLKQKETIILQKLMQVSYIGKLGTVLSPLYSIELTPLKSFAICLIHVKLRETGSKER